MDYGHGRQRGRRILITLLVMLILLGIYMIAISQSTRIYKGITIKGVDVGGLAIEEAEAKIKEQFEKELARRTLLLKAHGQEVEVDLHNLGISYDYYKGAMEAYKVARGGNLFANMIEYTKLRFKHIDIDLENTYNQKRLNSNLQQLASKVNTEAVDASISFAQWVYWLSLLLPGIGT